MRARRTAITRPVLTGLFLALAGTAPLRAEAPGNTVLVLLSTDSSIHQEGLAGIRQALGPAVPVETAYLSVLGEEHADVAVYLGSRQDLALVIAIGSAAARVALRAPPERPVLISMVDSSRALRLAEPTRPLCGVSMNIPISEYFRTLKEIAPQARRVVALYSTPDGEFLAGEGEYFDEAHNLLFERRRVGEREDFTAVLADLRETTDAIYMIPDPLYDRGRFQELSEFARSNQIVLMSGFRTLVRLGATFGYSPDYARLGVLTGEMANRLLGGKSSCAAEGIVQLERSDFFFYLNEEYARASGLKIPGGIQDRARLTGLTRTGITLFNDARYRSARGVFEGILKRDPGNRTAAYYLPLTLSRLTGGRVDELLRRAREAESAERADYTGAARLYREVLVIHPGLGDARDGLQRVSERQGEVLREKARREEVAGKTYAALATYAAALRVSPTNSAARGEMEQLRARLRARQPEEMQRGITNYNERKYDAAIEAFDNVLLVEPGNREAAEYSRLSRRKRAALLELRRQGSP